MFKPNRFSPRRLRRSETLKRIAVSGAAAVCAAFVFSPKAAHAQPLVPVSATGTGTFNNSANLIIDGFLPPKGTFYQDPTNVWWTGLTPQFTVDLGKIYNVTGLNMSLDNNDNYQIQYSTNNITYTDLITVFESYGTVQPVPGGLDIFSSNPNNPNYVPQLNFGSVQARYIRVFAIAGGGDNEFAIGEIRVQSAPEPGTLALLMSGLMGAGLVRCSRRK